MKKLIALLPSMDSAPVRSIRVWLFVLAGLLLADIRDPNLQAALGSNNVLVVWIPTLSAALAWIVNFLRPSVSNWK
jgi:hypothetical protein